MKGHIVVAIGCTLAVISGAPEAHAWRETGHFTVCEIALQGMTKTARDKLSALMGSDFATQCTWPDVVRESSLWQHTRPWHFADIDEGVDYFYPGAMHAKGDVVRAILVALAVLRKTDLSAEERRQWVRFLSHFVGDIHQPLHVGRTKDGGGNLDYKVEWYGKDKHDYKERKRVDKWSQPCGGANTYLDQSTGECIRIIEKEESISLHKVWDFHAIDKFTQDNFKKPGEPQRGNSTYQHREYAQYLLKKYAEAQSFDPRSHGKIIYTLPINWMEENLELRERVYKAPPGEKLGDEYYKEAIAIIHERIFQAGVRLADLLNQVFDPKYDQSPERSRLKIREEALRARIRHAGGWAPYTHVEGE